MKPTHIDGTSTVNEVVAGRPAAALVLTAFGIDTCCGGHASLDDASRRAGADPDQVLAALEPAHGECSCCRASDDEAR